MAHANLNSAITNQVEQFSSSEDVYTPGDHSTLSSLPITIPKKPPRSNASSHSSSSYASVVDQMSLFGESATSSRCDFDDATQTVLPNLPTTSQQLEHTAARDRISVKIKRRQPLKQKLSTLGEVEDDERKLFSHAATKTEASSLSTPEEVPSTTVTMRAESKAIQPMIDLSDINTARARLRLSTCGRDRDRDRSADKVLLVENKNQDALMNRPVSMAVFGPRITGNIPRSISFKRPQETPSKETNQKTILSAKPEMKGNNDRSNKPIEDNISLGDHSSHHHHHHSSQDTDKNESIISNSIPHTSAEEHIYDNPHALTRHKRAVIPPPLPKDTDLPAVEVKAREHLRPVNRSRPKTMHVSSQQDAPNVSEFENIYNQLKKRGSIRKVRPQDDKPPPTPPSLTSMEEEEKKTPLKLLPPIPREEKVATPLLSKPSEEKMFSSIIPVAMEEEKAPESPPIVHPEQPPITPSMPIEEGPLVTTVKSSEISVGPTAVVRRRTVVSVHLPTNNRIGVDESKPAPSWIDIARQRQSKFQSISNEDKHPTEQEQQPPIKSTAQTENRLNRKLLDQSVSQPTKPPLTERDSIRALKASNPNRINSLIQFFDK